MTHMLTKHQLLEPLASRRNDAIVVTTMGVVRPWGQLSQSDLDFASSDSAMGHTADFALGLAMARPERKVICLNGDGSMLMTLGTLATVIESGVRNLILFVVVNSTYEITGNQPIPAAGRVSFAALARAAGFEHVYPFDDADTYTGALDGILRLDGPVFISVAVEPGEEGPINRRPSEEAAYLQVSLAESARRLRQALIGGSVTR